MKKKLILFTVLVFFIICIVVPSNSKDHQEISKADFTILLSNDDGYNAPGLKALAKALAPIAMIFVAAPANQQSGAGHGITYREPIFVWEVFNADKIPWYAITAKPATCARLGIESLIKDKPDLIVSGINKGENLGWITFHSGTVGAAREAHFTGLPAIATSLQGNDKNDYKAAAEYIRDLIKQLRSKNLLNKELLLNINFPSGIASGIKGTKITKLGTLSERNVYHKLKLPFLQVYKVNQQEKILNNDPETDINAFSNGYVTITPLSINQTNTNEIEHLKRSLDN